MVYADGELYAAEVPLFAYPEITKVTGEVVWHEEVVPEPLYLPEPEIIDLGGRSGCPQEMMPIGAKGLRPAW